MNQDYGGSLLESSLAEKVVFVKEEGLLELSHILRIHDFKYVMKLMNASSKAVRNVSMVSCSQPPASVTWIKIRSYHPNRLSKHDVPPRPYVQQWMSCTNRPLLEKLNPLEYLRNRAIVMCSAVSVHPVIILVLMVL